MLREEIIRFYENYKKGTYVRVEYSTSLNSKTKASAKKEGVNLTKRTIKTCRLGCKYDNMEVVKIGKNDGTIGERECYEMMDSLFPNLFYYNKKSGKWYLRIGNVLNNDRNNVKVTYYNNGKAISKEEAHSYLQPSAINNSGSIPIVQNLCLENVIAIG